MRFHGMTQGKLGVNAIDVSTSLTFAFQQTADFQFGNDLLHRAFGDAYRYGHVAKPNFRILKQADEHMRVVRQKRP